MAKVGSGHFQRVSPVKPTLKGARNYVSAQMRAASHTRKGFLRLVAWMLTLFGLLLFMGLWMAGLLPQVKDGIESSKRNTLMSMGFAIERIDVIGEGRLDEVSVRRALGAQVGDYFFALDLEDAQTRLESLPWVEHVVVRRLWPDRLVVQIVEKRPYALWQHEGTLRLVDAEGEIIAGPEAVQTYAQLDALVHMVGAGAPDHIHELKTMTDRHTDVAARISSVVRVGTRWDLNLEGNIRVQLPEKGSLAALDKLAELHRDMFVLDRDITNIDLRLADRLVITPATDAAS